MKKRKIILIILLILIVLLSFAIVNRKNKAITSKSTMLANASGLSNKLIAWGVKREKNHVQPDLGTANLEKIKKYNGMAIGNKEDKYVYLTFDIGYEAGYTEKILDVLKQNNVKAVFFITGHYLNTASDLVKRMIDEGQIVRKSYSSVIIQCQV